MNPDAEEQYLDDLANGNLNDTEVVKSTPLNVLWEQYKLAYDNLVSSRANATEYDDLDTLYA